MKLRHLQLAPLTCCATDVQCLPGDGLGAALVLLELGKVEEAIAAPNEPADVLRLARLATLRDSQLMLASLLTDCGLVPVEPPLLSLGTVCLVA